MPLIAPSRTLLAAAALALTAQGASAATLEASLYGHNTGALYDTAENRILTPSETQSASTHLQMWGDSGSGSAAAQGDVIAGTLKSTSQVYLDRDYCVAATSACNAGTGGLIEMSETFTLSGTGTLMAFMHTTGEAGGNKNIHTASGTIRVRDAGASAPLREIKTGARTTTAGANSDAFAYDPLQTTLSLVNALSRVITITWTQYADTNVATGTEAGVAHGWQSVMSTLGIEASRGLTVEARDAAFPVGTSAGFIPTPNLTSATVPLPGAFLSLGLGLGLLGWTSARRTGRRSA